MADVNDSIRKIIDDRGIKLTKISLATGIKYQRLNRMFNQHSTMSASEFISLCSFLKIDPKSFMSFTTYV